MGTVTLGHRTPSDLVKIWGHRKSNAAYNNADNNNITHLPNYFVFSTSLSTLYVLIYMICLRTLQDGFDCHVHFGNGRQARRHARICPRSLCLHLLELGFHESICSRGCWLNNSHLCICIALCSLSSNFTYSISLTILIALKSWQGSCCCSHFMDD